MQIDDDEFRYLQICDQSMSHIGHPRVKVVSWCPILVVES